MSRSYNIDCIVLRHFDLGEADRILVVFSRELGKASLLAKGVRRIVSRKAGSLEIGNQCKVLVFEGKNFYIIQEVQLVNSYQRLKGSLGIIKYLYYILELIDALLPEKEEHTDVYTLCLEMLAVLNTHPRKLFIRAFEVKLLTMLGYLNMLDRKFEEGAIIGDEFLSDQSLELLKGLQILPWTGIGEIEVSEKELLEIEQFMKFRIERVVERRLKSLEFLG